MTEIRRPANITELFSAWRPCSEFIAGGTDWIIKRRGKLSPETVVIDLSHVAELKGISEYDGMLRIGAMETMTALHSSQLVRRYAAALADAAYCMGSEQIRNRATVGGNVANSSPAADTPSALAALGAEVIVSSADGERRMCIEEIIGRNENRLSDGEVIREFMIPICSERVSAFLKIGSRSQVSISRINIAVSAVPSGSVYKDARVFVGTLGSAAQRCPGAENTLAQTGFEEALPDSLCAFAEEKIPGRPTLPYKKSALRALAADVCAVLCERGRGGRS